MHFSQKQIVVGVVLIVALAYGSGYGIAKLNMGALQAQLDSAVLKNTDMEKQLQTVKNQADSVSRELISLREQAELSPPLEPYVLDGIRQRGFDPVQLLENLKKTPSAIPEAAVLGGTMAFTETRIINNRWVYGAYEDGHIAGAAIFQWDIKDSTIEWTPVLVLRE